MSKERVKAALALHGNVSGAARMVLVVLAWFANGDGECWPAQATIARKSGYTERRVRSVLVKLERDGYIERRPPKKYRWPTTYYVVCGAEISSSEPEKSSRPTGNNVQADRKSRTPVQADPFINTNSVNNDMKLSLPNCKEAGCEDRGNLRTGYCIKHERGRR